MSDFWIILTGSLVAISCGLVGCFLVLRKMSMIGDAISHAVLPGIFFAFLIAGHHSWIMLFFASLLGVFCTFLIETFTKKAKLQSDAAIGMVFTFLFAVGVILISAFAERVDLDQDCVLYGEITFVPLEEFWTFAGISAPQTIWQMVAVLFIVLGFVIVGYKGLFITTFDPAYAAAVGISVSVWHYLLMGMVSLTTVVSFESVGAILVVAFLIGPAATAHLLTDKLPVMLLLAVLIGILSAAGGYYLAFIINGSISGAMTSVLGILFTLALLFSPSQGIFTRKFFKKWNPFLKHNTKEALAANQMNFEYIKYTISERVVYITLNRPQKRNAFNARLVEELKTAFEAASVDDLVRVVVLNAEGKVFSAGADLGYIQSLQNNDYDANLRDSEALMALFEMIYKHSKPVIAQVQGHAIAGGCGLATVCDLVYAAPNAKFGYTEVKIGFIPAIVMVFLLRKIGETKAKALLLTGNLITAQQACDMGLINGLAQNENDLREMVNEVAQNLCRQTSGDSLRLTKRMIAEVQSMNVNDALKYAASMNAKARSTPDCKKGIASFLNKEKLEW